MILLKSICMLLSLLPLSVNRSIGATIGRICFMFSTCRKVTEQNIALCFPNLTKAQQQHLVKRALIENGKYSLENCFIWHRSFANNQQYILASEGLDLLISKQPTILLVPHFGGFEITGRVISLLRPMHFLYRKSKNAQIDKLIFNYRNQHNLHLHTADTTGIRNITLALKQQELIGILPDQSPQGAYVRSLFLGVPTNTTTLLSKLTIKYQARVLLTYALRVPKGYKLVIKEVDISAPTIAQSVQKMQDVITELVTQYPEQYLWNYKKFKQTFSYEQNKFKGEL